MEDKYLESTTTRECKNINPINGNSKIPEDLNEALNIGKFRSWKHKISYILDHKYTTILMTTVTIYALFGDDVRNLSVIAKYDSLFYALAFVALVLFAIEIILSSLSKKDYIWSFYFWLDLVGTISLVSDIGWIYYVITGNTSNSIQSLQNIGKASRAGTRSTRIVRIIRIIRLIRIVKLYKGASNIIDINSSEISHETKVGKILTDRIIKKVIIVILGMLLILPLFEGDFWTNENLSWDYGVKEIQDFLNKPSFDTVKDVFIDYHKSSSRPLIYFEYTDLKGNHMWNGSEGYSDYRLYEVYSASSDNVTAVFETTLDSNLNSVLGITKTVYICLILSLAGLIFYRDADLFVIKPIEKIVSSIRAIAKDPLQILEEKYEVPVTSKNFFCCKTTFYDIDYETQHINSNIEKISVLLALGFGEAGSRIINANINDDGNLDLISRADKVAGIFGFCDIRNFTDTTEELQEDIMVFVNEIAGIVHLIVDRHFGAANKNIGDAFLVVWKFDKQDIEVENNELKVNLDSIRAKVIPDLALLSVVKILVKINTDSVILAYRAHCRLARRMPGYCVKIGFGLHIGWAIEGAIGSYYKIDVSYLSAHVNLASKLEASTKIYGVPLLISDSMHAFLSNSIKSMCRQVDYLYTHSGNTLSLFTFDGNYMNLPVSYRKPPNKGYTRYKKNEFRIRFFQNYINPFEFFNQSLSIEASRETFTPEFYSFYRAGFEFYMKNRWVDAKKMFEDALGIIKADGPTVNIMKRMMETNYTPIKYYTDLIP